MNERGIEQAKNGEKISQIGKIMESLDPSLNDADVNALKEISRKITIIVEKTSSGGQKTPINNISGGQSGAQVALEVDVETKGEKERAKILLRTAVDSFLKYARYNEDAFDNGRLDEKGKRGPGGISFLTAGGGLYASSWATPSEKGFEGDLRAVEGGLDRTKMMADSAEKEEVLKNAKEFMPDVVAKIEPLLKEYDGWGSVYRQKVRDANFSPSSSFLEMTNKVCEAM